MVPVTKFVFTFLLIFCFCCISAQQDTIYIHAETGGDLRTVHVQQKFRYTNPLNESVSNVKLLNWISAYRNRGTSLAERKLEDQKKELYFAHKKELGKLLSLQINGSPYTGNTGKQNLFYPLEKPLLPGESILLNLTYTLQLPSDKFTGYGYGNSHALLKYFFIVPDGFESQGQPHKDYLDIEETQLGGTFWKIQFQAEAPYSVESNLPQISENHFEGSLNSDPQFYISLVPAQRINVRIADRTIPVVFGYIPDADEQKNLEFYLPLQLNFIEKKIGKLPEKILISEKCRRQNDFFGNDDIRFWKFRFQMFSDAEKTDMDYFNILSTIIMENSIYAEKKENHWIKNGLKTYLEYEYLNTFYKNRKLLGDLPDNMKFFGIRPLRLFNASKLMLTERYGLTYQYIASQNLDQKIGKRFDLLSNFNVMAISQFETGILFHFIAEKMGISHFDLFIRQYFQRHPEVFDQKTFYQELNEASNQSSGFLQTMIERRQRINFSLGHFEKTPDSISIKVKKNTPLAIPFRITAESENAKETRWFDTQTGEKTNTYTLAGQDISKIQINSGYIFPESNFRDNYVYTKGFFSHHKKVKFKLFQDIPNPEYNEIYINPRLNFNIYDKVLLGMNFKNKSLFDQNFIYSVTPYYSTGMGQMTGSVSAAYSLRPVHSFFRNLQLGFTGTAFHYDYDLEYRKISGYALMNFNKNPRSTVSQGIRLSYNFFEKDLTPEMMARNDYDRYRLWNLSYGYSDSKAIHEVAFGANFQWMKDFQKISGESFYRWEYASGRKISFRLFAGYFFRNHTRNSLFDYGISRISNYSFSYGLLGQSATEGILSQQFVLAEGGFKSFAGNSDKVNQWMISQNIDAHIWKCFNIYADAAIYRNRYQNTQWIWDSGIKLKVIPDFLEIYFPVQSTLGFEPSFKDYGSRIRYTLVFDLASVTNYFRRGWF